MQCAKASQPMGSAFCRSANRWPAGAFKLETGSGFDQRSGQFESASEEFQEIYSVTEFELRGGTSAFEPSGRTRQRAAWRTVSLAVSLSSYVTLSLSVSVYVCAWLCCSVARSMTVCSQPSASRSRRRDPVRASRSSSSLPLRLQATAAFNNVHEWWI